MGVGGRQDFCSQLVKYGMFISNLIIFVSRTFPALLQVQATMNSKLVLIPTDWRRDRICSRSHYTRRSQLLKRIVGHEPVFRCRLRPRHHIGAGLSVVVLRLLRSCSGSEMHAVDGK
jgi:hypothetical protein